MYYIGLELELLIFLVLKGLKFLFIAKKIYNKPYSMNH